MLGSNLLQPGAGAAVGGADLEGMENRFEVGGVDACRVCRDPIGTVGHTWQSWATRNGGHTFDDSG